MRKILIIEDDQAIADIERDYLELENFSVDVATDGATSTEKWRKLGAIP